MSKGDEMAIRTNYAAAPPNSLFDEVHGGAAHTFTDSKELRNAPIDPMLSQCPGLLPKNELVLVVAPPGACSLALRTFFAAYLVGAAKPNFGAAHYPGAVLAVTHSSSDESRFRAVLNYYGSSGNNVSLRCTERRFNWKATDRVVDLASNRFSAGPTAGVIIDAGPVPTKLDEAVVDAVRAELTSLARTNNALVMLFVESSCRSKDPFDHTPRPLRILRDTLLAVPLRTSGSAVLWSAVPRFILIKLDSYSPFAFAANFTLAPVLGCAEASCIHWDSIGRGDPREVFRNAETACLAKAQKCAVELAIRVINQHGPVSMDFLQRYAADYGVARTTMRDALSVAREMGELDLQRIDGKSKWCLPSQVGRFVQNSSAWLEAAQLKPRFV